MRAHRRSRSGTGGRVPATLLLVVILLGFGGLLYLNAAPDAPAVAIIPTQIPPTAEDNAWSQILREGFGDNSTPLPTVAIPTQPFFAPTLPPSAEDADNPPTPANAAAFGEEISFGFQAATPTPPPPTLEIAPDVTVESITREPADWQPPPLMPPLSRDPLGRDHYWLRRPVDSNANNAVLFYYPYGSDGPEQSNPWRVHHGVDMPNPVGETVRAAGDGLVVWAADGRQEDVGIFQNSPSYGNVIVIEHDFGYRGQPVWTLYAHLSAALVRSGERVQAGQVIGLVGSSGFVSGPHVHFEVRVGENRYRATYNPVLWMVPYVNAGVIAGRITDADGAFITDADITLRSRQTGLVQDTTTSYVFLDTGFDVNPDPIWQENFTFADVPVGVYDVVAIINGETITQRVEVLEGTTNFVELKPEDDPTPTPGVDRSAG